MNFARIKKASGSIELLSWQAVIDKHPSLKQAPIRKGVNPFTQEEVVFSGEGVAYFIKNGEPSGNICLENGELLTTGVPQDLCKEIAAIFMANVYEDDRS